MLTTSLYRDDPEGLMMYDPSGYSRPATSEGGLPTSGQTECCLENCEGPDCCVPRPTECGTDSQYCCLPDGGYQGQHYFAPCCSEGQKDFHPRNTESDLRLAIKSTPIHSWLALAVLLVLLFITLYYVKKYWDT